MAYVLLVEDNLDQAELLNYSLKRAGHAVANAQTGNEAIRIIRAQAPDIAIVDVILPDMTGFDVCRAIRHDSKMPVLFFSSVRISEEDRVRGFSEGGQDYLIKSHSHTELIARLNSLLARAAVDTVHSIRFGSHQLTIHIDEQQAAWDGLDLPLTTTEFKLLARLMRSSGGILSFKELGRSIWHTDMHDSTMIKVHMSRLRKKFTRVSGGVEVFRTVRGRGYALLPTPGTVTRMPPPEQELSAIK